MILTPPVAAFAQLIGQAGFQHVEAGVPGAGVVARRAAVPRVARSSPVNPSSRRRRNLRGRHFVVNIIQTSEEAPRPVPEPWKFLPGFGVLQGGPSRRLVDGTERHGSDGAQGP